MSGDAQNDPLLDVVDDSKDEFEDLNDEFYDACSIDPPNKAVESGIADVQNDDSEFHDPKPDDSDEDLTAKRIESEKLLSDEELEASYLLKINLNLRNASLMVLI